MQAAAAAHDEALKDATATVAAAQAHAADTDTRYRQLLHRSQVRQWVGPGEAAQNTCVRVGSSAVSHTPAQHIEANTALHSITSHRNTSSWVVQCACVYVQHMLCCLHLTQPRSG